MDFLSRMAKSIGKVSLYYDFGKETIGKAIVYMLILSTIVTFLVVLGGIPDTIMMANDIKEYIDKNVGEFSFSNGELEFEKEMPIIIRKTDEGGIKSIYIIDTTGQTTKESLEEYDEFMLISKSEYYYKSILGVQQEDLSKIQGKFTSDYLKKFIMIYALIATVFIFILVFIQKFFINIVIIFVLSLLVLMINIFIKKELEYKIVFKLGMYAITLPMFIKAIFNIISIYITDFNNIDRWYLINIGIGGFVSLICIGVFLIYQIKASIICYDLINSEKTIPDSIEIEEK